MDINYNQFSAEPRSGFAKASMIMGALAILTLSTFFMPIIFGALGVLFAFLAKKGQEKFRSTKLFGFVSSLIGLIVGGIITIFMVFSAFHLLKPENKDTLNQLYEQVYGVSFDEYADSIYGGDFSELLEQFYEE